VLTCRDMSELVTDYLERATPIRVRVHMWLHLWRCEACRRYFNQVRQTAILLASHRPRPPTQATEEDLLAAARGQQQQDL
jgi:predicted anti-sigma-YlaC factor YlaD